MPKKTSPRLHREAPDPLYAQLKNALTADVASGRYQPHQRLPSERELSIRFQVSRMTVRQALLALARDGLIYSRAGRGTFVAEPKIDQQLRTLTGFTQDVRSRGGKPTTCVLEAKVVAATPEVSAALRILPKTETIMLSRLRLADGEPLAIETAHLPLARFPGLLTHNFEVESLYDVLENKYDVKLTQAEQTIEAAIADPHESELLELPRRAAVLSIRRLTLTDAGAPVEYVCSVYRGDRYKFHSTLNTRWETP